MMTLSRAHINFNCPELESVNRFLSITLVYVKYKCGFRWCHRTLANIWKSKFKKLYIVLKYMKNLSLTPQRATAYGKG